MAILDVMVDHLGSASEVTHPVLAVHSMSTNTRNVYTNAIAQYPQLLSGSTRLVNLYLRIAIQ